MTTVFKICPAEDWREAERIGHYAGSPADGSDGFIHLSTAAQAVETAARHFAGQADLVLVEVAAGPLGAALRWEPSRGGDLFPHLYGPLPVSAALRVDPLPLGPDGRHLFPGRPAGPARFDPAAAGWRRLTGFEFMALVGPLWSRAAEGETRYGFLAEERHLNRSGVVHGGMVMTFIDQALGKASWQASAGRSRVTIQLDTHFAGPIREGDFAEARCRVVKETRSLMFMAAEVTVAGSLVASASGIWKLSARRAPAWIAPDGEEAAEEPAG